MVKKPTYQELEQRVKEFQRESSELKRVDEALRKSEQEKAAILDSMTELVAYQDSEMRVLWANRAAGESVNLPPEKLVGRHCYKIWQQRSKPCADCPVVKALETGEPQQTETTTPDGRVWFIRGYPIVNAKGDIMGAVETTLEITERKQKEEALRESEEFSSSLLDNSPNPILVINPDTSVKYVNPALENLTGFSSSEIIGRKAPYPWWTEETLQKTSKDLEEAMGEGAQRLEELFQRKNGERFWVEITFAPVKGNGEFKYYLANWIETTERKRAEKALKESEARYRALFQGSAEGILVTDIETKEIIHANPAICRMLGYTEEELQRMSIRDIHPKEDLEHVISEFEAIAQGDKTLAQDISCLRKDGTTIYADITGFKILIDERECNVGFFTDITKEKKLQAQLQESQKMEAIATLAGGIAHEFNNTLVGITGNIDLLQMNLPEDGNIDEYAQRMRASALHMAHLTDQLLAYARGGKYQPKNISLTDLVDETLPLIKQSIAPSIRIETDLLHDILNVEADLTQMQMVLSAILNNSAEAIEEKGRIRITTRDEEIEEEFAKNHPGLKPGPYVSLTVEDDGKGMDEETRAKIFDPFFTTKLYGRGLGMAAVYGIVTNHGGWISVDSQLGKGTIVRMYLPAVKVEVKEKERPKIEPAKGTGTILVIEDEDVVIDVICAMVERLGYRVLLARTGREALSIAKGFDADIDLAILDILLPDLPAKEVYRDIMEARPNLKVIVCSGYAIDGPPQEIMDAGAQDFIQKPFSYATLSERLKEVLEGK